MSRHDCSLSCPYHLTSTRTPYSFWLKIGVDSLLESKIRAAHHSTNTSLAALAALYGRTVELGHLVSSGLVASADFRIAIYCVTPMELGGTLSLLTSYGRTTASCPMIMWLQSRGFVALDMQLSQASVGLASTYLLFQHWLTAYELAHFFICGLILGQRNEELDAARVRLARVAPVLGVTGRVQDGSRERRGRDLDVRVAMPADGGRSGGQQGQGRVVVCTRLRICTLA
ncbi:hypothetical protein BC828DRAFT_403214 [Blastocladiella britannica]|nr:hypothetical protein BC828DRAFT_403214 [Blastocladiella britannica]